MSAARSSLRWLTNDARIGCPHPPGAAQPKARQRWVTFQSVPLLVGDDPVGRQIVGCPFSGVAVTPCVTTLMLLPDGEVPRGHSAFVRVDGHPAVLENVEGYTDGTPPGTHHYRLTMSRAGQDSLRISR